ncbi:hypothetical protein AXF15_07740 [Desulfomicrobium orale DSM 12838]|uniref:Uncharacterized protein n=1 Tax=Desulfomicrobium orale DSM 12838 TaxID=888061 RepID=A0A109W616_9BACT|nr:hypothetical protein AXF15_07740 [Desulfomicrobium orale DSM 12838]
MRVHQLLRRAQVVGDVKIPAGPGSIEMLKTTLGNLKKEQGQVVLFLSHINDPFKQRFRQETKPTFEKIIIFFCAKELFFPSIDEQFIGMNIIFFFKS